ncbi:Pet494p Ecym_2528 [Eremothecium cymbalariae DBVPG|uniref:Uncharacterized protein n=1 Tax=Eremothecium cymbalariae (strain CBS 270.75 / DBVPG 7215 / KCTC 17166 / NRRL Y-17582) TaxID=931890 RepID=G8JQ91_ERECY|nr:Hypothetical protein Ecym_2528 [Eremothecium cymbalariae DBVPG\
MFCQKKCCSGGIRNIGSIYWRRLFHRSSVRWELKRLSSHHRLIGKTLWRYFNAPGNVLFVTTNMLTLTTLYTYSIFSSYSRRSYVLDSLQHGFPIERDVGINVGTEEMINEMFDNEIREPSNGEEEEIPKIDNEYGCAEEEPVCIDEHEMPDPCLIYTEPEVSEHMEPVTPHSRFAKMSLFYLFYSYHLFKDIRRQVDGSKSTPAEQNDSYWHEQNLQNRSEDVYNSANKSSHAEDYIENDSPLQFYDIWLTEFKQSFKNLSKSRQFHLLISKDFPNELSSFFRTLDANPMNSFADFFQIYQSSTSIEDKILLSSWFFDYGHHLSKSNCVNTEKLYCTLFDKNFNDEDFEKYASIIFRPDDPHRKLFFGSKPYFGLQTASLESILQVLKTALKSNDPHKNDYIIKLMSLLRKHCYYNVSSNSVRILLPNSAHEEKISMSLCEQRRKESYQYIAKDPTALRLLSHITKGGMRQSQRDEDGEKMSITKN